LTVRPAYTPFSRRPVAGIAQALLPLAVLAGLTLFVYGLFAGHLVTVTIGLVMAFGFVGASHP
jgi:hypothetical protein